MVEIYENKINNNNKYKNELKTCLEECRNLIQKLFEKKKVFKKSTNKN